MWRECSRSPARAALLLSLLLAGLHPPAARAAPTVQVRGRAVLRMTALEHGARGLVMTGELLDRALLKGIPSRRVKVTVRAGGRTVNRGAVTDRWGRFRVRLPPLRGTISVASRFAGDRQYAAMEESPRSLDVARRSLDIRFDPSARELDAAAEHQILSLRVRSGDAPVAVPLTLRDGGGKLLARTTSTRAGLARLRFATARLGRPGPVTLQVHFAGSSAHNATSRRLEALLVAPVTLTLRAGQREVSADGEIQLDGQIRGPQAPLPRAAVNVHVLGQHAGTAVSSDRGRFQLTLPASDFPAGVLDLEARFTPAVAWRKAARSRAVEVTVRPARPISLGYYLVPALITALTLLALVLIRNLERLLALLRRLAPSVAPATRPVPRAGDAAAPARSGVRLARRSLRSMISLDFTISGEVWDATDGILLPRTRLELTRQDGATVVLRTGRAGGFRSDALAEGTYAVEVSRPGYMSERFSLTLPHRGSYHGLRVDLVQVRVRLLEIYQRTAAPLLPRKELWGCWTPQELMYHVNRRTGRRMAQMEQLTRLLEAGYWGQEMPREDLVLSAHELVRSMDPIQGTV